jgi:hypothetical protein
MSFTFPAALWALPAAGVPLAIHLLSRRSARRLPFSDLTLLASVEARFRPRSRLREVLLLTARTLLILALVLAAAGPAARGAAGGAAGESLDVVLLLDGSYSMRARDAGRTRFDAARDAGRRLLRRLAPGDRVAVGVFDEKPRAPLAWGDADAAAGALSRAAAGLRGTDAASALSAARDLLASSPRGRRRAVVVLGDGAAHMLSDPAPAPADGATVLGLSFPELPNAWIAGARPAPGSGAREPKLEIRVGAAGTAAHRVLDLWVGESRAGSGMAAAPAGGEGRVVLSLPPASDARAPAWSGRAAASADALPDDDVAYFAVRHRAAPRVLVLHSGSQFDRAGRAGWYLRELFGGGERSLAGRSAEFLAAARWAEADLSRYGAVVLPDAARLPPGLAAALERFASSGGGVWIIPDGRAAPEDLAALSAWLPARFGPAESPSAPRGLRVLRAGAETDGWGEFDLARVGFARRFRLEPAPGAESWLADGAGVPLLVAGAVGKGRAVVWAAPLDAEWTNLGLKPVFVPWALACLSLTSPPGAGETPKPARVGEALVRTWRADEAAPDRVVVRGPDGKRTAAAVVGRRAVLPEADKPGLYEFEEPNGARTTFAVNVDPSRGESDLTPAAAPPWTSVGPDELGDAFFTAVYGQDRRGWCLALAAVMLLLETLLALPLPSSPSEFLPPKRRAAALTGLLLAAAFAFPADARAQQGDRFVWTQLQLGEGWDPYPDAPARVAAFLSEVTSARVALDRRVIRLGDPALFSSPFLYFSGREAPPELGDADLRLLRQYLAGGGFLWIEDSTGGPSGTFDRWVRRALPLILPEAELAPLPVDHVIERTFFLLRGPAGRVRVQGALEGASLGGRVAVLYTRDDVLGAWAQDALGHPLKACVPGGEAQRELAKRETLNVLMYSMTGSYKADAVHQAAILDKLRGAAVP